LRVDGSGLVAGEGVFPVAARESYAGGFGLLVGARGAKTDCDLV
jgi:hypothetical protein